MRCARPEEPGQGGPVRRDNPLSAAPALAVTDPLSG